MKWPFASDCKRKFFEPSTSGLSPATPISYKSFPQHGQATDLLICNAPNAELSGAVKRPLERPVRAETLDMTEVMAQTYRDESDKVYQQ